jgi:putative ABC transport system permease protein
VIWRAQGTLAPDSRTVDVMAIDPDTFATAATWGTGPELAAARRALGVFPAPLSEQAAIEARNLLPALVVGAAAPADVDTAILGVGFTTAPVQIRQRLTAFPGATRPTVVVDARALFPRLSDADNPALHNVPARPGHPAVTFDYSGPYTTWIWTGHDIGWLKRLFAVHKLPPSPVLTLAQAEATPVLTSARWAAGYQVVLGVAAALLGGLSLVVAADRRVARAAPVDLVLRRFGVRPARLLRLRAVELLLTWLAALAALVLPLALLVFLLPRLVEPDAGVPPGIRVRVGAEPLLLAAAVALATVGLAIMVVARRSAALRPGEVLRDEA